MFIRSLSSASQNFKSHYTNADIGASSILGSLKISAIDEKTGEIIAKERLSVFDKGESRSEDKFESNVARRVADFEKTHKNEIEKHDKDNEVKLTVCYPGPSVKTGKNSTGFLVSNFFYDDNRQKRFNRPINTEAIDKNVLENGVNLVQSRHANDMGGAGACLLDKLKDYPELLQEGEEIMYMYPGGGLGSGMISVDKDNIRIRPMELQHMVKYGTENDSAEKDVSAAILRKNFAEALNVSPDLIGENTKAVDNYEEACSACGYNIGKKEFEEASKEAISKFMDSLAQMIAIKVCEAKLKTVVLTGPIVNSLHNSVNKNDLFEKNPDIKDPDKFSAILKEKVQENLTDVGKNILGDPDNLNVVFLKIADNTDGAQVLQQGESVGNPIAWYNIKK